MSIDVGVEAKYDQMDMRKVPAFPEDTARTTPISFSRRHLQLIRLIFIHDLRMFELYKVVSTLEIMYRNY